MKKEKNLALSASIFMIIAGLIHFYIVPEHWSHTPAHGLMFILIGIIEVVWGVLFWRKQTIRLFRLGLVIAGASIVLWGITRVFPAPFEQGPEGLSVIGVVNKIFEGLVMFVLIIWAFSANKEKGLLAQAVLAIIISVIIGSGMYGVGKACEPFFPWLRGEEHDMPDYDMHKEILEEEPHHMMHGH
jgi:hypothetical protein